MFNVEQEIKDAILNSVDTKPEPPPPPPVTIYDFAKILSENEPTKNE